MDRGVFFAHIKPLFGGFLLQRQVDGINAILDAIAAVTPPPEERWQAYMLATTLHETARTMQPIEEYGRGRGRAYGHPVGAWHQVYDGRGDVQLTWERNYAFATTRLRALGVIGADEDLERTPDLAMRPDIAAAIMIHGMAEGWFTGKKLSDFFSATRDLQADARTIINGHDCAGQIAGYHRAFLAALQAARPEEHA